jgi:tetratricopeptide (TPR) repeat protein
LELLEKIPDLMYFQRHIAADLYIQLGRNDKAESLYGPVYLASVKNDAWEFTRYAQFWQSRRKNLNSAMEAIQAAIRVDPAFAESWAVLSELLLIEGKTEEARQTLDKAAGLAKDKEERERYEKRRAEMAAASKK